jgi:excisionase family DNA binding protein
VTVTSGEARGDLLTVAEAAELLRTTPSAIYQWRRRRQGPPGAVIGARLLFRRDDLLSWVAQRVTADARSRPPLGSNSRRNVAAAAGTSQQPNAGSTDVHAPTRTRAASRPVRHDAR